MFIWKNLKEAVLETKHFQTYSKMEFLLFWYEKPPPELLKGFLNTLYTFMELAFVNTKLRRKLLTNCEKFVGSAVSFIWLLHQCIQVCIYNWGMITYRKLTYSNIHRRMSRAVFLQACNLLLMNAFQNFAPDSLNTRVMPRFIFIRNQNSFSLMIPNTFLSFSVYLKFR